MAYAPSSRYARAWWLVGAAVILAGLGVAVIREVVTRSAREAQPPTLTVAVAAHDLYVGAPITAADLTLRAVPRDGAPTAHLFATVESLVGRTPRERILADEPVRAERLADAGTGTGLNVLVAPGRRAMVLPSVAGAGLTGRAAVGNHVDVLATLPPVNARARGARWTSSTLLRDVRVLAVPESASAPGGLTLEVDPWQAERLALALARGDVRVALRSDTEPALTPQRATAPDTARAAPKGAPKASKAARTGKTGRAARGKRARLRAKALRARKPAAGLLLEGADRAHQTFQADGVGIATVDGTAGTLPRPTPVR
ncbi:MAG: Flp pilus assembly protein CpaB [Pseudomonadota bacterium]|jgi:pilus assembly protein CpaB